MFHVLIQNADPPQVDLDQLAMVGSDMQLLATLEASVQEWSQTIEMTLRDESQRPRESKYPMAEIEFWRDRASSVPTKPRNPRRLGGRWRSSVRR